MGQQGLIFVYLPALLVLSAAALDSLAQGRLPILTSGGLALLLLSSAIFLLLPEYPLGAGGQRLLTRQTLVNSDQYFLQRFAAIRQTYKPQNTLILAENWHHVQYYLPDYKVIPFNLGAKWEIDQGTPDNNANVVGEGTAAEWGLQGGDAQVVIFDPSLLSFTATLDPSQTIPLSTGKDSMVALNLPAQALFYVNADAFGVEAK